VVAAHAGNAEGEKGLAGLGCEQEWAESEKGEKKKKTFLFI